MLTQKYVVFQDCLVILGRMQVNQIAYSFTTSFFMQWLKPRVTQLLLITSVKWNVYMKISTLFLCWNTQKEHQLDPIPVRSDAIPVRSDAMLVRFSRVVAEFSALPTVIYMLKVNNRNITRRCKICSKLIIKTSEGRPWPHSGVFIVNFGPVSPAVLALILLALNI